MKFSKSLNKTYDFQNVYKNGKSYANRYLVMYVLKRNSSGNRIGISVSKKVGNSVIRHRVKRLIRESYRVNEDMFLLNYDIVVIARASTKNLPYYKMEEALIHLGKIQHIINE